MELDLKKINKIHFIGIGGIGVSAVARILQNRGKRVSGSDNMGSEITDQLAIEGINVLIPQKAKNISSDIELVVYSVAVPEDNPERRKATELQIAQLTYPQLLGQLMKENIAIGVSGTDGKTTTTAMTAKIFIDADLDPTVVLGSKASFLGGNSRVGSGDYFIFESDEYGRALLNYSPKVAAVTHVSADHLDCYKDLADIKSTFSEYLKKLPDDGFAVINNDDGNSVDISQNLSSQVVTYGIRQSADLMAKDIKIFAGGQKFNFFYQEENLGEIILPLPGRYNVYNALAAIAIALIFQIDFILIKKSLSEFAGLWRRFEMLGERDGRKVITDYAHTPDALAKVIQAAKEFLPDKRVLVVFQPHQYNRTKNFFNEFVEAFAKADSAIISDIFFVAGRENPADFDVSSQKIAEQAIKNGYPVEYGGDLAETEKLILDKLSTNRSIDAIIFIGAGNIYNLAKKIINK